MSETMKAGRELDAMIAEKVLGYSGRMLVRKMKNEGEWRIAFKSGPHRSRYSYERFFTEDGTKVYCGEPWTPHFPPLYSTDIAAAWEVVERVIARGFWFDLQWISQGDPWEASINDDDAGKEVVEGAATAPLAICLAALKAITPENPALSTTANV